MHTSDVAGRWLFLDAQQPLSEAESFVFPSTLQRLSLSVGIASSAEGDKPLMWLEQQLFAHISRLLESAGRCSALIDLRVFIHLSAQPDRDMLMLPLAWLQPLRHLHSLRTLQWMASVKSMYGPIRCFSLPTAAHTNVLRSLPHLTDLELNSGELSNSELQLLLAEPLSAQLCSFALNDMRPEHLAPLLRLQTLTRLSLTQLQMPDPAFLANLPQLQDLTLTCEQAANAGLLAAALGRCTHLTRLQLEHPTISSEQLASFLPYLPHLRELDLYDCEQLRSLSFLSGAPNLASTLQQLLIADCPSLPLRDLPLLFQLTALESLALEWSFDAPLDDATQAMFDPNSSDTQRCLPNLREFSYRPRWGY